MGFQPMKPRPKGPGYWWEQTMNRPCCTKNSRSSSAILAEDEHADICVGKVLEIRRQLAEVTYNIADHLDVVAKRIIEDLAEV
jgi:hypothetical protein